MPDARNTPDEASLADLDAALGRHPADIDAHYRRAHALHAMQRLEEALQGYARVLALQPNHVDALCNRGAALFRLGHADEAQASWQAALQIDARHPPSLYNMGHALHGLGHPEQALAYYDRALHSRPDYVEALCNYGLALQALNRIDEAQICYRRALQLQPDLPLAHWNLGLCRLRQGDYASGWREYEWGWAAGERGMLRRASSSLWRGEIPLAGKRIILIAEQGLGDTLQFCRYAPLLAAQGAHVWLEVQAPLLRLLGQLPGVAGVYAQGETPPEADYHCPLLSLPLALGTRLDTIPAPSPYLRADPELVAHGSQRLAHLPRPRVGIAWSGNPQHRNDALRSIPLALLVPAVRNLGSLVRIQTDARPGDAVLLAEHGIFDDSDTLRDFADTAALLANLDHVVSVDTAVAHLAGAMGVPTTLMLPYAADFRWLLDRSDSPWYPSLRLLRQATRGDWSTVLTQLSACPPAA